MLAYVAGISFRTAFFFSLPGGCFVSEVENVLVGVFHRMQMQKRGFLKVVFRI